MSAHWIAISFLILYTSAFLNSLFMEGVHGTGHERAQRRFPIIISISNLNFVVYSLGFVFCTSYFAPLNVSNSIKVWRMAAPHSPDVLTDQRTAAIGGNSQRQQPKHKIFVKICCCCCCCCSSSNSSSEKRSPLGARCRECNFRSPPINNWDWN